MPHSHAGLNQQPPSKNRDDLIRFYAEATRDYGYWSPNFNMHFGYFHLGMNPFNREKMLEQMTSEVLKTLHLSPLGQHRILDMGCGVGASMRHAGKHFPNASIQGISIVTEQIAQAVALTRKVNVPAKLNFTQGDFTATPFPNQTFHAIYALESLCHGDGPTKEPALREAYRLLKPGGRICIADGFLKRPLPKRGMLNWLHESTCQHWRLQQFAEIQPFAAAMKAVGFRQVTIKEISWRIAPSVVHIPVVTLKYILNELVFRNGRLSEERWSNMLGSLLGLFLGLARTHFGYFMVTAKR